MISENTTKVIRSLVHKKYREKYKIFIVEGKKSVLDMLKSGFSQIKNIYLTKSFLVEHPELIQLYSEFVIQVDSKQLEKISNLDSVPEIILIGWLPEPFLPETPFFEEGVHVYMDMVQDPGNVGTIFRTAEWFGVKSIGLSEGCADYLHPKVIQSSMGSFCRLNIWQGALPADLNKIPIYGADLAGTSVYKIHWPTNGILIIGSEGRGIQPALHSRITQLVHIPGQSPALESLNAATAAAIILSQWLGVK